MPEPAHAEFVGSVDGLVSECGAMGGGIWSRNVPGRRQRNVKAERDIQRQTNRIRMTDRDTER